MRTYAMRAAALLAGLATVGAVALVQVGREPRLDAVAPSPVALAPGAVQVFCPMLAPPSSAGELRADGTSAVDSWQPLLRAAALPAGTATLAFSPLEWEKDAASSALAGGGKMAPATAEAGADLLVPTALGGEVSVAGERVAGLSAVAAVELASTQGAYAGLAASPCAGGGTDQWLVGGASSPDSGAIVRLINQSSRVATVDIEVFGATGAVSGGTRTVRLNPSQGADIPLEVLAPGEGRPAVHLRSNAAVSAIMLAYETQGLAPGGLAVVNAASPSTEQVLLLAPGAQSLRLVNPSQEPATVSVEALTPAGKIPVPGLQQIEVWAGAVTELPLGLRDAVALVVRADVAVLAAARSYAPLALAGQVGGQLPQPGRPSASAAPAVLGPTPASTSASTPASTSASTPGVRPGGANPSGSLPAQTPATTFASASARATPGASAASSAPAGNTQGRAGRSGTPSDAATVPFHPAPTGPDAQTLPGAAASLEQLPAAGQDRDMAWSTALPALESASLMAPRMGVVLVANPAEEPVTVRLTKGEQSRQETLPPGAIAALEVEGAARLDASGPVRAAVLLSLPGGLGGIEVLPVLPSAQAAAEMQVLITP